jgi:hypothetical protein
MFGLFKKTDQTRKAGNQYAGRKFGPFVVMIPEDWECINDNGILRANKDETVRINISLRDMSQVSEFSLDNLFETIKAGYYSSDINWAAYSEISKKDDAIYQTLEYLDDPRLILAVVKKNVEGRELVLIISFAGNSGKEIENHLQTFNNILENIH